MAQEGLEKLWWGTPLLPVQSKHQLCEAWWLALCSAGPPAWNCTQQLAPSSFGACRPLSPPRQASTSRRRLRDGGALLGGGCVGGQGSSWSPRGGSSASDGSSFLKGSSLRGGSARALCLLQRAFVGDGGGRAWLWAPRYSTRAYPSGSVMVCLLAWQPNTQHLVYFLRAVKVAVEYLLLALSP